MVGKQDFKVISRWLGRMDGDPSDAAVLNRDVAAAERELLHDVRAALASSDVLSVAFSFLALQRRLQLKVVSGLVGGVFLKKNEGRHVQQVCVPVVRRTFYCAFISRIRLRCFPT